MKNENKLKVYSLKKNDTEFENRQIKSSKDAVDYIRQFYSDDIEIYESFFLLMLNRSLKTIGYVKISQGGIFGTVVDPIIVAKYAVDSLSTNIILAHNHPSGQTRPSEADKAITEKIKQGLKFFDITVSDHVILTKDSHFSFSDEGIL